MRNKQVDFKNVITVNGITHNLMTLFQLHTLHTVYQTGQ